MDCSPSNSIQFKQNEYYIVVNENVCGYTLKQLETVLKNMGWAAQPDNNLNSIRSLLINSYSNPTENQIENYFQEYYLQYYQP